MCVEADGVEGAPQTMARLLTKDGVQDEIYGLYVDIKPSCCFARRFFDCTSERITASDTPCQSELIINN